MERVDVHGECELCAGKPETGLPTDYIATSIDGLRSSAKHCAICRLLYDIGASFVPGWHNAQELLLIINTWWRASNTSDYCPEPWILRIDLAFDMKLRKLLRLVTPTRVEEAGSAGQFLSQFRGQKLPHETSSQESLDWARSQMERCERLHDCIEYTQLPPLPNRVLDVGTTPKSNVRLYLTHNEPARYICLSHCWGALDVAAKTIRETLGRNIEGIAVSTLPKTFRDAIDITRRLGVRFLWIDALCIIQNDEEDWQTEAPRMLSVYRNTFLTIAATASPDGNGGCYRTTPIERQERTFTCRSGNGSPEESTSVLVREDIPHDELHGYKYPHPAGPDRFVRDFPLLRRAWVYQERLLSARTLHFCNDELLFECGETAACQCGWIQRHRPPRPPEDLWRDQIVEGSPTEGIRALRWNLLEGNGPRTDRWGSLVEDYSGLAMTLGKDGLSAISAVARVFAQDEGDRYLAGLWRSSLDASLSSLFWVLHWDELPWRRPRFVGATVPSWSWASVIRSRIKWPRDTGDVAWLRRFHSTLLDAHCVPVNPKDDFGCLKSGTLILTGRVTTGTVAWEHNPDPHKRTRLHWELDGLPAQQRSPEEPMWFWFNCDYRFDLETSSPAQVFYLWIFSEIRDQEKGYEVWRGLVLLRSDQNFERIGVCSIDLSLDSPWKEPGGVGNVTTMTVSIV